MKHPRLTHLKLTAAALCLSAASALAIPAHPGVAVMTQPDGSTVKVLIRGDEHFHFYTTEDGIPLAEQGDSLCYATLDARGVPVSTGVMARDAIFRESGENALVAGIDVQAVTKGLAKRGVEARAQAPRRGPGLFPGSHFPAEGEQKAIVILVQYADVGFNLADPYDYFSRMLNEEGFAESDGTGSARDYFMESSMGKFKPEFDVYGPVTLSHERAYYGGNNWYGGDARAWEMALEAVRQLDPDVDFTQYDRDGDGKIDNVFMFYAGMGEHAGGGADCVWPHASYVTYADTTPHLFDGVQLDSYGCTSEWMTDRPDGIGPFCHEFGHILGLPDLYATAYSGAFTFGPWVIMDMGPYNNNSRTPPVYGAFERYALGWIEPRAITAGTDVELAPIATNDACIVKAGKDEFFLFENRQQAGWDKYIPGHGMLVTHVLYDEATWASNRVNNDPDMLLVDLEEADGTQTDDSRDGDVFPGVAGVTSFTDDTAPSMRNWENQRLSLPITDITETDGLIRFKVAGGARHIPAPTLLEADEITPEGFTLHWEKVKQATDYRISLSEASCTSDEGGETEILSGDTDNYTVTGLTPDTQYRYTLTAIDADGFESPESDTRETRTAQPTFEYKSVEIFDPTAMSATSWIASWAPLEEADDYELTVMTMGSGRPFEECNGFDNGIKNLPEGWATDCTLTYANAAYAATAVPSLKMGADGCYLQSPTTNDDIHSVRFWHRGVSCPEGNTLKVEGRTGDKWLSLGEADITNDAPGRVTEISDIPAGTRCIRISLILDGKGAVALDDVTLLWGARQEPVAIPGYEALRSQGATSVTVEVSDPHAEYRYHVTALSGDRRSRPSRTMTYSPATTTPLISSDASPAITLDGNTLHISAGEGIRWMVSDITGLVIASGVTDGVTPVAVPVPAPGIYIVRAEEKTMRCLAR